MVRHSIITLLFLVTLSPLLAQDNYIEGSLTLKNGGTRSGFINYQNWKKNPKEVQFRSSLNSKVETYKADVVKDFQASGEIYIGAIVEVDKASNQTNSLPRTSTIDYRTDTVFLQVLVRGAKNLYRYDDINGRTHFFFGEDTNPNLLIYRRYKRGEAIVANNTYLNQLTYYLGDCDVLQIENVIYKESSLLKIFASYSQCTQQEPDFIKTKEKSRMEFGLWIGGTASKLFFKSSASPQFETADFPVSINGAAGFFVEAYIPRTLERWAFNGEVNFNTYKTSATSTSNFRYDFEFAYSYIRYNVLLRYYLSLSENTRLFLNAGWGLGLAISSTNFQRRTTPSSVSEEVALPGARNYEHGWSMGLGLSIGKISAQLRYEPNGAMSAAGGISSRLRRFYLMVGYSF